MKSTCLFLIFISWSIFATAQSKWGIEFKGSRFNTSNSGQLQGGNTGEGSYTILEEDDLLTYSQSLGVIYRFNERNLVKLHFGSHQNGRVLSIKSCSDVGCETYNDINEVYQYFQIAASYAYRILNKRFMIPVEAGININRNTNEVKLIGAQLNKYNFDYEISIGVDYRLDPELIIGIHGLFTGNINEYQNADIETGTFLPKSIGLEFSIIYEFGKTKS
jgi:hypothetical protein